MSEQVEGNEQGNGAGNGAEAWTAERKGILADLAREREARRTLEAKWAEVEPKLAEHAQFREKLTAFEAAEQARTEAQVKANQAAIEALPDAYRALIPEGLSPEATAAQIARIAALPQAAVGVQARGGAAGGLPPEAIAWFETRGIPEAKRTLEYWNRVKPK